MSQPHIEVIPRITDTSIAATYPTATDILKSNQNTVFDKSETQASSHNSGNVITQLTVTQKFFNTLRDYMIPILFIIAVTVIIYVFWKYWTTYRNKSIDTDIHQQNPNDLPIQPDQIAYQDKDIDFSKYLISSESINDVESIQDKLSTIDESEDSDEEESDKEDSDEDNKEDSDEEEDDNKSIASEPDFSVITNLINQPMEEYSNDRFEYLNDNDSIQGHVDENDVDIDTDDVEEKPDEIIKSSKRTKKPKRVVL